MAIYIKIKKTKIIDEYKEIQNETEHKNKNKKYKKISIKGG